MELLGFKYFLKLKLIDIYIPGHPCLALLFIYFMELAVQRVQSPGLSNAFESSCRMAGSHCILILNLGARYR